MVCKHTAKTQFDENGFTIKIKSGKICIIMNTSDKFYHSFRKQLE